MSQCRFSREENKFQLVDRIKGPLMEVMVKKRVKIRNKQHVRGLSGNEGQVRVSKVWASGVQRGDRSCDGQMVGKDEGIWWGKMRSGRVHGKAGDKEGERVKGKRSRKRKLNVLLNTHFCRSRVTHDGVQLFVF